MFRVGFFAGAITTTAIIAIFEYDFGRLNMRRESGFSLILVMVVIIILSLGATMFMGRSGDDMSAGASRRDSDLSQGLAEAAASLLLSRFISEDVAIADIDGDDIADRLAGYADLAAAPSVLALGYSFYPESGDTTSPIQRIATGESTGATSPLASSVVPAASSQISVNDLFVSETIRPLLFTQGATGFSTSNQTWSAEQSPNKAAVWFEYELNAEHEKWADVYVASMGQVGRAKSYVRRYVGSYTDQLGGMISPITESAMHAGGDTSLDTCTTC